MLTISFTEYDDLDQKAELFEVPEDYEFPLRESFQSKLDEKHGLFDLMVAFYNTTDSDYREELRRFMYQEVKIVDSLEDNNPIGKAVKGQLKISSEKNENHAECSEYGFSAYWIFSDETGYRRLRER